MRICYIAEAASIHTQKWVKYFADKGHNVHLISARPFGANHVQHVNLHVLRLVPGFMGGNLLLAMIQIARILRTTKPDILHGHYATGGGFWAALCGFHPYVLTAWGSDILIEPKLDRLARSKATFALKRADVITCDAEHLVKPMVELGAIGEIVRLVNFGVDTRRFHPNQRDEKLKEELQVGSGSLTILSLRNFYTRYDVESFVKAIPLVIREVPEAKFIAAGDGEQRSYLEKLASSLGVSDNINFIGWIPNDKLPRYFASVDIYVSTSLSDAGISGSTAEAMACELPVVITDFGDNGKWVKDGEGGFLIPLKSPTILAEKLIFLLRREDIRRKFGKINRMVIEERNNYHKEMEKMELIYQELMEDHRS